MDAQVWRVYRGANGEPIWFAWECGTLVSSVHMIYGYRLQLHEAVMMVEAARK